jgi:hypothetical protein
MLVAVYEALMLAAYVYDDIEGDKRQHGNLFHADDAYTFVVNVSDAAALMLAV